MILLVKSAHKNLLLSNPKFVEQDIKVFFIKNLRAKHTSLTMCGIIGTQHVYKLSPLSINPPVKCHSNGVLILGDGGPLVYMPTGDFIRFIDVYSAFPGFEEAAQVRCPYNILGDYSYTYTQSGGSTVCEGNLEMCSNHKDMVFSQTSSCSTSAVYSGKLERIYVAVVLK